ncbi:hypothetical protein FDC58_18235 [Clostridium botulinum]|uniref:MobV family relaxase n=1 Tax=unclassified Clostridium TaxID=2614128 RepID=UPI00142CF96D|nr:MULTISPECIES: MobV family relaxase [unclassified Clostridium]NFP31124.1 hypothetical protein [Clostridium botulinum]
MSFAIIRNVKYKMPNLQSISRHNERQNKNYGNKDIDVEKSHLNYHLRKPIENSYEKEFYRIREENNLKGNLRLTGKKQSNVACEFLITSDNDFFRSIGEEQTKRYFQDAYEFACKKCGEDNIISATVHMDETTPHMHLTYIPVVEGVRKGEKVNKINASEFWKGFNSYGELQNQFHSFMVARDFNLERGEVKKDKAEHLSVEEFKLKIKSEDIENAKELIGVKEKQVNDKLKCVQDMSEELSKIENHMNHTSLKIEDIHPGKTFLGDKLTLTQQEYGVLMHYAKKGESKLLTNRQLTQKVNVFSSENKNLERVLEVREKTISSLQYENSQVQQLKDKNRDITKKFNKLVKDVNILNDAIVDLGLTEMINKKYREIKRSKQKSYDLDR